MGAQCCINQKQNSLTQSHEERDAKTKKKKQQEILKQNVGKHYTHTFVIDEQTQSMSMVKSVESSMISSSGRRGNDFMSQYLNYGNNRNDNSGGGNNDIVPIRVENLEKSDIKSVNHDINSVIPQSFNTLSVLLSSFLRNKKLGKPIHNRQMVRIRKLDNNNFLKSHFIYYETGS